jgi:hypothetical protein
MKTLKLGIVIGAACLAVACDDNGNGGAGSRGTVTNGIVWDQDGVATHASSGIATTTGDSLEVIALSKDLAFTIFLTRASGPLAPGTFQCEEYDAEHGADSVSFTVTPRTDQTLMYKTQSCSVELLNAGAAGGANASGEFSATVLRPDGVKIEISNGYFDVPLLK